MVLQRWGANTTCPGVEPVHSIVPAPASTDPAVAASLDRDESASGYSLLELRDDLSRWAGLLMGRSPKP